jgi:Zn finger protein HypA/HybF involved in hydrogenase expression
MSGTSAVTPIDRATVVFESEPEPALRCSHCRAVVTDADAECPACESPIDWGASTDALHAWEQHRPAD